MPELNEGDKKHCRDRAFYAYGTGRIFEKRARTLSRQRHLITFLGIAVPLVVGGTVLSFGTDQSFVPCLFVIAGVLMILQLVVSVWSLVARWDERYSYAVGASQSNTKLYNDWKAVLDRTPNNASEKIKELDAEDQRQEATDVAQHITDKEKRFAMRSTLFYMKLSCLTCSETPQSMKSSKCDTCGNF
ncbi:MAG: mobilome CxxCx(11)CxxC protein [Gammaproteobacteria bacterium]